MSVIDHNASARGSIKELGFNEVDEVSGGFLPIVGAVIVRSLIVTYGPKVATAAGVAAGAAVTAIAEFDD